MDTLLCQLNDTLDITVDQATGKGCVITIHTIHTYHINIAHTHNIHTHTHTHTHTHFLYCLLPSHILSIIIITMFHYYFYGNSLFSIYYYALLIQTHIFYNFQLPCAFLADIETCKDMLMAIILLLIFLGLLRQVEDVVDGFGTLVYPIVNRTINLSSCKILLLLIIVLAGKVYIYICVYALVT